MIPDLISDKRSGRPSKTTPHIDRIMRRLAVGNPFITATQLQSLVQSDYSVTLATTQIKRRLKRGNLSVHTPARKTTSNKMYAHGSIGFL